jgi:membrane protein implicated in regulation of membrane protease activity
MPTMTSAWSRSRSALGALALVVVVVVAFLAGMLVERLISHAERDDMLRRYDQALREHRARVMETEKQQTGDAAKP